MAKDKEPVDEWVLINRHLQRSGFATCDVSNLILEADALRNDDHKAASFAVMTAARDVLENRRLARVAVARAIRAESNRRRK